MRIVEEGIATPAQVDKIVNDAIGGGGPFNVMDLTHGNVLVVHIQELMRDAGGSSGLHRRLCWRSRERASGAIPRRPKIRSHTEAQAKQVMDRILAVLLARSFAVAENGVCEPSDLNWLIRMSLGFNEGMLDLATSLAPIV